MNKKMHSTTKELTIKVPLAEVTIQHGEEPINEFMEEMIDVCMLGVCFDVHRALRLGYWDLEDDGGHLDSEIVDVAGLDVFGQQPIKKHQECVCPNCARTLAASRFAPHLEKCMGMGRNSSRIASRRLQTSGRIESNDYGDMEGELDIDWSFENDRKNKKLKRERDKTNSPKRNKMKKSEMIVGLSSLVNNGSSRPGTPCSTTSGELAAIKNGPTVQALETLSQEEKVALLTQTCGAISEHTGKMCTRTGRCVQHTDEQRRSVRDLLLGDTDDVPWPPSMRPEGSSLDQDEIHIDVDGYEDTDAGNLLRDLTPLSWEQESNISTGSESTSTVNIQNSPISKKKKKTKARKNRMR